jgi:hypothetical protein
MTTYLELIRPAMINLAREAEPRAYRREPCFRMHIVACVGPTLGLRAGETGQAVATGGNDSRALLLEGRRPETRQF